MEKTMRKIYLIRVFFLFAIFTCLESKPVKVRRQKIKKLTLNQAVEQALKRKPTVQAFEYNVQNYKHQRKTQLSEYLPNVSLSEAFYNVRNSSNLKNAFGISASQTILDLSTISNVKLYSSYISSAKHTTESHKDLVRISTETAFLNGYLLQEKLKPINLLYQAAKENFEKAKNRFNLNLINKSDFLAEKTTYAESLSVVNLYKDEVKEGEKNLEYYIGEPIKLLPLIHEINHNEIKRKHAEHTELKWNPDVKIKLQPFSYFYKKALENRKDLKVKQDSIDSEHHTGQSHIKQYLPKVSISGTITKNVYRSGNSVLDKDVSLLISWNVFDGLSNYFNKSAADARKMKAILERNDLIVKIKREVQSAYTAAQKALYDLRAQKVSYSGSKSTFRLQKQQFKQGLISKVEFQSAEYSKEQSRFILLTRAANTVLRYSNLLYNCGYPQGQLST
jgi:outer membrane protein TolC